MIKKVNVYPVYPILTIKTPIYHTTLNIELGIGDIERCIYGRAKVEEILPNGKMIPLTLENYKKCNYMEEHISKSVASLPENGEDVNTKELVEDVDSGSEAKEATENDVIEGLETISPEESYEESEVEENLVVDHNRKNKKQKK